jgi:hexosaminidase
LGYLRRRKVPHSILLFGIVYSMFTLHGFRFRVLALVPTGLLILALTSWQLHLSAQGFNNQLLPQPKKLVVLSSSMLTLTPSLSITAAPELEKYSQQLVAALEIRTGIQMAVPADGKPAASLIRIVVKDAAEGMPYFGMDESYTLRSNEQGILIESQTVFGLQRAIATLIQLVQPFDKGFAVPYIEINDAPRFAWRGLMLDTGRHFLPVDELYRTVDAMAAVKLNVLHLHLTENQGFRIESRRFPQLALQGANGEYYTQADMRLLVAYAGERGIRVVPEFDVPGHSTSWFVGYPALASASGPYKLDHTFGVHDEALDPTLEATYDFLDAFFAEMAAVFPDEFVHVGGDESTGKQWLANPRIVAYMREHGYADTSALQAYFIARVREILARHGKKMIGWDEILASNLASDTVIENWHGPKQLGEAEKLKLSTVYAKPYYLDHGLSAEEMYAADPVAIASKISDAQDTHIMGGEVCMWGEQVTGETIDSRIWPRAAAVAERMWSPATVNDTNDLYRRLDILSLQLDRMGTKHLSGPQRLMRQLSDSEKTGALSSLANAVEPYSFHDRAHAQHNTVDTPMNGFVDAVVYDPPLRHRLAEVMAEYLGNDIALRRQAEVRLREIFESWCASGGELASTAEPRLQVTRTRAQQLADLGQMGLTALNARGEHRKLSTSEAARFDSSLSAAKQDDASFVRFVVLTPMSELLAQTR